MIEASTGGLLGLIGAVDQGDFIVGNVTFGHMGQGVLTKAGDQRGIVFKSGKGDCGIGGRTTGIGNLTLRLELFVVLEMMGDVIHDVGGSQSEKDAFVHERTFVEVEMIR